MRMQNSHPCKAAVGITFLVVLLIMTGCKARKENTHPMTVSKTMVISSKIELRPAVLTYYIFVPGISYLPPFEY